MTKFMINNRTDACKTDLNLINGLVTWIKCKCDLAHHESPIAQWLERPTGIWTVMVRLPLGAQKIIFLSVST